MRSEPSVARDMSCAGESAAAIALTAGRIPSRSTFWAAGKSPTKAMARFLFVAEVCGMQIESRVGFRTGFRTNKEVIGATVLACAMRKGEFREISNRIFLEFYRYDVER